MTTLKRVFRISITMKNNYILKILLIDWFVEELILVFKRNSVKREFKDWTNSHMKHLYTFSITTHPLSSVQCYLSTREDIGYFIKYWLNTRWNRGEVKWNMDQAPLFYHTWEKFQSTGNFIQMGCILSYYI